MGFDGARYLFALLVLTSCTPARSRDTCSPTVSPNGTRAARFGEHVIMECGTDKMHGLDKIEWRLNNKRLSPSLRHIMNSNTLILNSTQFKDTGNYMCLQNNTPVFNVRLIVQQIPRAPTLSCFVKSYLSPIRCQWRSEELNRLTKCTLSFRKSVKQEVSRKACRLYTGKRVCVCLHPHKEGEDSTVIMALTVSNSVGCAASEEKIFKLEQLLKPDPPESVKIKPVLKAAHKLSVSWSYPQTWQTGFYALKFELAYSMQNTDMFQNKVSLLETSFVITDALPDVNYTVRVRAKEEFDHGAWSNWSEPVYGMPWADPERNKIPEDNTEGLPSGLAECEDCDWEGTTPQESQSEQWGSFPWYGLLLLIVSLSLVIGLFAVIVIRYRKKWKGQSAEKGSGGHPPEYLPVRLLTISDGDGASKAPECIAETALQCGSSPESRSTTNASDDQPHFDLINMGYFYIPQ